MRRLWAVSMIVLLVSVVDAQSPMGPTTMGPFTVDLRADGFADLATASTGAVLVERLALDASGSWSSAPLALRAGNVTARLDEDGVTLTAGASASALFTFGPDARVSVVGEGRWLVAVAETQLLLQAPSLANASAGVRVGIEPSRPAILLFERDAALAPLLADHPLLARFAVGATPRIAGDATLATATDHVWLNATLPDDRAFAIVGRLAPGTFGPVERLRQIVPTVDGHALAKGSFDFGVEVTTDDLPVVAGDPGPFYNLSRSADGDLFVMLAKGPGNLTLELARDVTPPRFLDQRASDATTYGFLVVTRTDEPALAQLDVWPEGKPERSIPFPTTTPAFEQTFPVQGLASNGTFEYRVTFHDFSGNANVTPVFRASTLPKPDIAGPVVLSRSPGPNETLAAPPGEITATFELAEGRSVPRDGLLLFVDKRDVTAQAIVNGSGVRYVPPHALGTGPHSVGLEITDSAGGRTVSTWTFEVAPKGLPALGVAGIVLAALAAAVVRFRRVS